MKRSKVLWTMAREGIRRHREIYIPYRILLGLTLFITGLLTSLFADHRLTDLPYMNHLQTILGLAVFINTVFIVLFIDGLYKRLSTMRQREYATWFILGLTRRELFGVGVREILLLTVETLLGSVFFLLLLYGLAIAAFSRLSKITLPLVFFPNPLAIVAMVGTAILLAIVAMGASFRVLRKKNSRSMLLESTERPVKKSLLALHTVLGLVLVGLGYFIAVSVRSPMDSLIYLFIASTFVMAGTHSLFRGVLPLLLRLLQRLSAHTSAKAYVRNALLRSTVRREASGLANICITACGALVLLVSTSTLFSGVENAIETGFPHEINFKPRSQTSVEDTVKTLKEFVATHAAEMGETTFIHSKFLVGNWENGTFHPLEGEAITSEAITHDTLRFDVDYEAPEAFRFATTREDIGAGASAEGLTVTKDMLSDAPLPWSEAQTFYKSESVFTVPEASMPTTKNAKENITFSFDAKDPAKTEELRASLAHALDLDVQKIILKSAISLEFLHLFSSIYFVGIILAVSYLVATATNVYYKQLLDAEDAKKRFSTMWRIGMKPKTITAINASQARRSAFLPLLLAYVHILVASVLIRKFLMMIGLADAHLFYSTLAVIYAVFALAYFLFFSASSSIANRRLLGTILHPEH